MGGVADNRWAQRAVVCGHSCLWLSFLCSAGARDHCALCAFGGGGAPSMPDEIRGRDALCCNMKLRISLPLVACLSRVAYSVFSKRLSAEAGDGASGGKAETAAGEAVSVGSPER